MRTAGRDEANSRFSQYSNTPEKEGEKKLIQ
jgi:hypothetical protein